jgi:predicted PurR-regulated permease PerM
VVGSGLPRGLVVLLGMAAAVVVIAGMRGAASLLGPAFLALVLTIAVHPLRGWLDRYLPTWAATLMCLLVVNLLIVGLAVTLVAATARFATLLPDYEVQFDEWVADVTDQLHHAGVSAEQVHRISDSFDLSQLTGFVTGAVSGVFGVASSLVFILTLILFMTIDGGQFPRHLGVAAGVRPGLVDALRSFARGTRSYLLVSTVFGFIVAVLDTVVLALLDVPAPVLWGLLAFLTNYIPNIGFVIGLVPPAVLALLEGGPGLFLTVVIIYCVLNLVIQTAIQPKVVGDAVGLSTTLTFMSLVFWSWVIGPLGAILAIPLSLLVRSLLVDADPANQWLGPLVANRDPDPHDLT